MQKCQKNHVVRLVTQAAGRFWKGPGWSACRSSRFWVGLVLVLVYGIGGQPFTDGGQPGGDPRWVEGDRQARTSDDSTGLMRSSCLSRANAVFFDSRTGRLTIRMGKDVNHAWQGIDESGFVRVTLGGTVWSADSDSPNFHPGLADATRESVRSVVVEGGDPAGAVHLDCQTLAGELLVQANETLVVVEGTIEALGRVEISAGSIVLRGSVRVPGGEVVLRSGAAAHVLGSIDVSADSGQSFGGFVQVLGEIVELATGARIDASGYAGGGVVLFGAEDSGRPGSNARLTELGQDSQISADATARGNGGTVIIWADDTTHFAGSIFARGGSDAGDGGFVEVSGREHLRFRGHVDLGAARGGSGTLLLDPTNIVISNGTGDGASDGNTTFSGTPSGILGSVLSADTGPTTIYESELEGMAATTHVVLQATNDITINNLSDNTLNLTATTGSLSIRADADADGSGSFSMNTGDTIRTQGGAVTIRGASLSAIGTINTTGSAGNAGGAVTLTGDTGTISVSGTITTTGGSNANGGALSATAAGALTVTGAITTSGGSYVAGNPGRSAGAVNLTGTTVSAAAISALGTSATAGGFGGGNGGAILLDSTSGAITVGGNLTTTGGNGNGAGSGGNAGSITINDAATINGNRTLSSVGGTGGTAGAGGNQQFLGAVNADVAASRTLTLTAGTGDVTISGATGATTSLASLTITANDITLADLGGGSAGISGVTSATSTTAGADTGVITLTGTTYRANAQTYTTPAGNNIQITGGATTTFTTTADAVTFATGTTLLADGSNLVVNTAGGVITANGGIRGTSLETVSFNAGATTLSVGAIGSGDEIASITLAATTATLNGDLITGDTVGNSISITAAVTLNHPVGTTLTFDTDNAANDGSITVTGGITGNGRNLALLGGAISTAAITTTGGANQDGGSVSLTGSGSLNVSAAITSSGGTFAAGNPGRNAGAVSLSGTTIACNAITAAGTSATSGGFSGGNGGAVLIDSTSGGITLGGSVTTTGGNGNGAGLGGNAGNITLNDPVTVNGNRTLSAVGGTGGTSGAGGNATILGTINADVAATRTFTVTIGSGDCVLSGAIGATTSLSALTITANDINLANIGGGSAGVSGATAATATTFGADIGSVTFTGTTYNANAQTYTTPTGNNLLLSSGAPTTYTTTGDAVAFTTGTLVLSDGSNLTVNTAGGTITAGAGIRGTSLESVTLNAGASTLTVGAIGAGDEIATVALTATTATLNGDIITGDTPGNGITITGAVTLNHAVGTTLTMDADNPTNDGAISISGGITGGGRSLAMLGAAIATAAITTTGGSNQDGGGVTLTGSGALTVSGTITTSGGAFLAGNPGRSAGGVSITGATVAVAAITAAGTSATSGGFAGGAGGSITLDATSGGITVGGSLTTTGGNGNGAGNGGIAGDIAISDALTLSANSTLSAVGGTGGSAGAGGNVQIAGAIDGNVAATRSLTITIGNGDCTIGGVAGGATSLSALTITANDINLVGIGGGSAGVSGATSVTASTSGADIGVLTLTGSTYNANAQTYTTPAGNNLLLNAGTTMTFTSTADAVSFTTGTIVLADGSNLVVNTAGGAISASAGIVSDSLETVNLTAGANTVAVGAIGGGDEIAAITITATTATLNGNLITGDTPGNDISITGAVTLNNAVGTTLTIDAANTSNDGNITITGTTTGNGRNLLLVGATIATGAITTTGGANQNGGIVTITAGGSATIGGTITTTGGTFVAGNPGRNAGAVTITGTTLAVAGISANGRSATSGGFAGGNGGEIILDVSNGGITQGGNFSANGGNGNGTGNGGNAGNITISDALTLSGNRTVSAVGGTGGTAGGGGMVQFQQTVDGDIAATRSLTVSAGAGDVTFSALVGGTNSLSGLTITGNDISIAGIGDTADGVSGATSVTAADNGADVGSIQLIGTARTTGAQTYTGTGESAVGGDVLAVNNNVTFGHPVVFLGNAMVVAGNAVATFSSTVAFGTNSLQISADEIDFAGNVDGIGGDLILTPGTTGAALQIGNAATAPNQLDLTDTEFPLIQAGLNSLVIGRADSAGAVTVGTLSLAIPTTIIGGSVALTVGGAVISTEDLVLSSGSGGIALSAGIGVGANILTLDSAGSVTQSAPIVASGIALTGTASFVLNDPANDVDLIAADLDGSLSYADADDLVIGTVGLLVGITTGNPGAGGDVAITTLGYMTAAEVIDTSAGSGGVLTTSGVVFLTQPVLGAGNITLNGLNQAPVLAGVEGTPLAYTESDPPTAITSTITISDVDNATLAGATIQITGNYQNGEDLLGFVDTAGIAGTWSATTGTLTLSGADTLGAYQAALRAVTYENTSDTPSGATRTVQFLVNDGLVDSNTVSRDVSVTDANDAPVVNVPGLQTTPEATPLILSVGTGNPVDVSDADAGGNSGELYIVAANGIVTLNGTSGLTFTLGDGTADAEMTLTGSLADINTALDGMEFLPDSGFRGQTTIDFSLDDLGHSGSGGAQTGTGTVNIKVPGISVNPTSGLVTTEAGGIATFTVVLDAAPAADVTIGLSSSNTGEGTVGPVSVTFTTSNWNSPQTVTVTGVNDAADDGDVTYSIVTAAATSSDVTFDGLDAADVGVANTDNDAVGITVNPISGLTTSEAGGTASFTVVLNSQPGADVVIGVSSSDSGEGQVSPGVLTFTSSNWNSPQTVMVTGVNESIDDGNAGFTIFTAPAASSDPGYDLFDAADVSVTNIDNDVAGVVVNPTSGLTTTEEGGTATFSVVLQSEPLAPVSMGLSSTNPGEGSTTPSILNFTSADWNIPQIVTVTGADDTLEDGASAYSIVTAALTSADPRYDGINPADVAVTNDDDDVFGVTVGTPSGLLTGENGGSAGITVVLRSQPTASVTIGMASADLQEGVVAPASVVFQPANWNVSQTVTVTGLDDLIQDGDVDYTILILPAVSADPQYNGHDPADVVFTNQDDDRAGIRVSPLSGLSTTEAAGSSVFTIALESQPVADVTIRLASSNPAEGVVDPATVTLTSTTWNVPQAVTILGVDDLTVDGDISYSVRIEAAVSADPNYSALDAPDIAVINRDDDAERPVGVPTPSDPTEGPTVTEDSVETADEIVIEESIVSIRPLLPCGAGASAAVTLTIAGICLARCRLTRRSLRFDPDRTPGGAGSGRNTGGPEYS